MNRYRPIYVLLSAVALKAAAPAVDARGADLTVAGSPAYNAATGTGFVMASVHAVPGAGVNNNGVAVGWTTKYVSGSSVGNRAVRWDGSGSGAIELANLYGYNGTLASQAYAINSFNIAVGVCEKDTSGHWGGYRPVRWNAAGTIATELGNLGSGSAGYPNSYAYAINDAGTTVGYSQKYVLGVDVGARAVRWAAGSTTATELGILYTDSKGYNAGAQAYAINAAGTAVGFCEKYVGGVDLGRRAVRWDASGIAVSELDSLGTFSDGSSYGSIANAINDAGTITGWSYKIVGNANLGVHAVRWDTSGSATELAALSTEAGGWSHAEGYAVNAVGTVVGFSYKYADGVLIGQRAVRWDASGAVATELANLGTAANGSTTAAAYAVNGAGTAVGYASKYVDGVSTGSRAAVWLPDASIIDLNTLNIVPQPAGGTWYLSSAKAISEDGWASGDGSFDPDGSGPAGSYGRSWVAQIGLGGNWLNTSGVNNTWGKGANWSTGTPAIQRDAVFAASAAYAVAFDKNATARAVNVTAGAVTLALGSFALTADQVTVGGGSSLSVAGNVSAGSAVSVGLGGSLSVSGGVNAAGVAVVNDGTLVLGGVSTLGAIECSGVGATSGAAAAVGGTTVSGGGVVTVTRVRQSSLALAEGAVVAIGESWPGISTGTPGGNDAMVSIVRTLSIDHAGADYSGTVDVSNNDLIIDYTGASSPLAAIEAMIKSGYNAGTWSGKGITSSVAAGNSGAYALVVLDNAQRPTPFTTFDGVGVPTTVVIVKFSWIADLDLDGVITSNDAIVFANNYVEGQAANHRLGDLNYNGVFDSSDAILFANAYNESLPHLPEPASGGAAVVLAGFLMGRRRR